VTEIFVERYGIGELSLLMPALTLLSRESTKRWIVWIAPPFIPYAPALLRYGVDLDRVLLVHPGDVKKDALWAVEQVLRSGSSVAVLAWLADATSTDLRRLQLAAEEHACWTVLFRAAATLQQSSPAALRLKLSRTAEKVRVDIVKCRGRRPGTVDLEFPLSGGMAELRCVGGAQ
jgi:cell division inhibitor SulA/protein ImuA